MSTVRMQVLKSNLTLLVYYDGVQEAEWFKGLHSCLRGAEIKAFPRETKGALSDVLKYDRPDIILTDKNSPILVVERTVEVPSGHNVGQRFGRLAAAAESNVPSIYFGPYAAYKHGGPTQGPRYMNLRLFDAIKKVEEVNATPLTTINWPVDADFEIIRNSSKDERMKHYLEMFFDFYSKFKPQEVNTQILNSTFRKEQDLEIVKFKSTLKRLADYDSPPDSISISFPNVISDLGKYGAQLPNKEIVYYRVGMKNIRSDPYTGMGILYSYLYCNGFKNRSRQLVLAFQNISFLQWQQASQNGNRKDIRLYRHIADWIQFSDQFVPKNKL